MTVKERVVDLAPWLASALIVAGQVHLVSILLTPAVATRDAYARLNAAVKDQPAVNGVSLLPAAEPDTQILPFSDPAMVEGVCLFDLAKGALRVKGPADADTLLALSFNADGRIFHSATDRAAINGEINIVVGDAAQIASLEEDEGDEPPATEIRLTAPARTGFVLLRSFAKRPSDRENARERLSRMSCETTQ